MYNPARKVGPGGTACDKLTRLNAWSGQQSQHYATNTTPVKLVGNQKSYCISKVNLYMKYFYKNIIVHRPGPKYLSGPQGRNSLVYPDTNIPANFNMGTTNYSAVNLFRCEYNTKKQLTTFIANKHLCNHVNNELTR